jgi:hypothetical protein
MLKKGFLCFIVWFNLIVSSVMSQHAILEGNGKVVIRKDNGSFVSTVESSGAVFADINAAGTEVLVTYNTGKVVARKINGSFISTVESSKAVSARWSGEDVVLTYSDGKVVKRKKNGSFISTIKS